MVFAVVIHIEIKVKGLLVVHSLLFNTNFKKQKERKKRAILILFSG